jgi:hypothetical protein
MHICPSGLKISKTQTPFLTQHFLKVNTHSQLIIDYFKILNVHNQTPSGENNNGVSRKLRSITISYLDCATFRLKEKKILQILLAVINNQYAFLIVIDASTLK